MYHSSGNYEAFARPLKPEGIENKSAYDIRDLLAVTISLRDGKPLTEMKLGFKEKIAVGKALDFIRGTDVEKLLKEYGVI